MGFISLIVGLSILVVIRWGFFITGEAIEEKNLKVKVLLKIGILNNKDDGHFGAEKTVYLPISPFPGLFLHLYFQQQNVDSYVPIKVKEVAWHEYPEGAMLYFENGTLDEYNMETFKANGWHVTPGERAI